VIEDRDPDPDEEPELVPPEAQRVAQRALVFAALVYRTDIEGWETGAEAQARLLAWLSVTGLEAELELDEQRLLRAPLGSIERQDVINAGWRSEGLAVLAWALGMMDLPPHDEQCPAAPIAEAFGFLKAAPIILTAPRLRTPAELLTYSEQVFAIHWRLTQFSLDRQAMDFAAFAKEAYFGPLEIEGLPLLEGDLAIRGEPLARSAHWREVLSITVERHQAANWLRGHAPLYSDVGTDT
jgi:hypothetical protein